MTRDELIELLADELFESDGDWSWKECVRRARYQLAALDKSGLCIMPRQPTDKMLAAVKVAARPVANHGNEYEIVDYLTFVAAGRIDKESEDV